jgi:hypothetical protein
MKTSETTTEQVRKKHHGPCNITFTAKRTHDDTRDRHDPTSQRESGTVFNDRVEAVLHAPILPLPMKPWHDWPAASLVVL